MTHEFSPRDRRNRKGRTYPAEPLTPAEVAALIRAASRRGSAGIRDAALVAVLAGSGLRLGEALALVPSDVDAQDGSVRVAHGKGRRGAQDGKRNLAGKARVVGLAPEAIPLLLRWIDRRRALGVSGKRPLFCGIAQRNLGAPLAPNAVRNSLARLGERAGIEKAVRPHGLRHSLAGELARRGVNLLAISGQLGHSSVSVTDSYLKRIAPEALLSTMRTVTGWLEQPTTEPKTPARKDA
jgi:integrase